jgi:hypothetical protein
LTAAIKKPRSGFSGGQNVAEKNRTKGASPTAVFCSPKAAQAAVAHTILLCAVPAPIYKHLAYFQYSI